MIECGTIVSTVVGNITGMISSYTVNFDKIRYEVTYFHNGEFKIAWLHEKEFIVKTDKKNIGFSK